MPTSASVQTEPEPIAPHKSAPHVILFMCDQLRTDALGFMGNPLVRTPNLDRLASRGAVFENMFVQSSVCMASRAAIHTGRYPRVLRMSGGSPLLDPREITLAETFQRRGYRTGLFGKLHLTPQQYTAETLKTLHAIPDPGPFLQAAGLPSMAEDPCKRNYGFQEAVVHEDALWGAYTDWVTQRDPTLGQLLPHWPNRGMEPWAGWRRLFPGTPLPDVGPTLIPPELHSSWFIAESAADFISRHAASAPCFLHVSFVDPHHPWDPPEQIARDYPPEAMPLPAFGDSGTIVWPPALAARTRDNSTVTPLMKQTTIAMYYAMIDMVDRAVGQVIDAVERAGQMENTVFAFIADHGELLGDYGLFRKGSYHYDCLIRVPAFISYPRSIPAPQRIGGLVQAIDFAPTLLSLAGVDAPPGIQGIDWSGALANQRAIGRDRVYTELYTTAWGPYVACWTIRTRDAKLNYYPGDRTGHLLDLKADPHERQDLYSEPGARGLRDVMVATLLEEIQHQADPLPMVLTQY